MNERILITVKTYPTLSRKYSELVCTAGITENGEWRRLYPIRFRQLYQGQQYQKYQWVEAKLKKSESDDRPESYKIIGDSLFTIGKPIPTTNQWSIRREEFLDKVRIYRSLDELIELAHENTLSIAAFRPSKFLKFVHEKSDREWDPKKLAQLEQQRKQFQLFADKETVEQQFQVVKKLPYKFSYQFEDENGRQSKLMIEDWEIGALYWNCLKSSGSEAEAIDKVNQKYWDQFVLSGKVELTLILGTMLEHHRKKAPNPFVIVSVVYPGVDKQPKLF